VVDTTGTARTRRSLPVRGMYERMFVATDEARSLKCSRCGEVRLIDDFAWKLKAAGRRDSWCRSCRKAYSRTYYETNRGRYAELERDPVVLEFDHLRDKSFNIGSKLVHCSWEKVLAEIAKCEVVCANCHRRRTSARKGAVRARLTDL
jgi:hypothetical protein